MKRVSVIVMTAGLLVFMLSVTGLADEAAHKYVGSAKCKVCHKSEKKGAQYVKWQESKHSKAYETLVSEKSIEIGKGMGIDNPQTSDKCLKCHVTAFAAKADAKAKSFDQAEGVGCEACHGAGSDYKKMKVMKDHDASIAAGMVVPNEETCVACHNDKSPTFEKFDFEEYFAMIAHPRPKKAE